MALSQKHSGKILVPWYNSHEWKYVYALIYSENSTKSDKQKAVEILQLWKIRMPILFAGLEGTLIILNAMLQDEYTFSKEVLSNFYALAIMRFLNLCAAHSDQQGTFFRVAKEKKLPEWLVNIRHDLAHSQKQSSLFMLKKGIEYCFEWLRREYWELQDKEITDFIITETVTEDVQEKINLYCEYVVSKRDGRKLSSPVLNMLKELKVTKNSNSNVILRRLLKNNKSAIDRVPDLVIESGYFLTPLSDDLAVPPMSYVQSWEALLQYLQESNVLMKLIEKLYSNCINDDSQDIQHMSSIWLKEIFKALEAKIKRYNMITKSIEVGGTITYVIKLHEPSETFLVELKKFSELVLENPHPLLRNYVACLMSCCGCNDRFIEDVENLLLQYFNVNSNLLPATYVPMTIEHVKDIIGADAFGDLNSSQEEQTTMQTKPIQNSHKKWSRIEDTNIYQGCPIGILPYQYRSCNPTISF